MIKIENAKQCKNLFKQIANDKNIGDIKKIEIDNFSNIDKEIIFCILKMLPPKLTTLILRNVNLSDKDNILSLTEYIKKSNLQLLDISGSKFGENLGWFFTEMPSSLKELNCDGVGIDDNSMKVLSYFISKSTTTLNKLSMANNYAVTEKGYEFFVDALKSNWSLFKVGLGDIDWNLSINNLPLLKQYSVSIENTINSKLKDVFKFIYDIYYKQTSLDTNYYKDMTLLKYFQAYKDFNHSNFIIKLSTEINNINETNGKNKAITQSPKELSKFLEQEGFGNKWCSLEKSTKSVLELKEIDLNKILEFLETLSESVWEFLETLGESVIDESNLLDWIALALVRLNLTESVYESLADKMIATLENYEVSLRHEHYKNDAKVFMDVGFIGFKFHECGSGNDMVVGENIDSDTNNQN